ncbi:MAG: PriCT-2 domain-containing protein, partial [Sulfurimicrobium sp.]|nr:PriCT-2 domain-containing protein [Sulfurimicrobium sp.]
MTIKKPAPGANLDTGYAAFDSLNFNTICTALSFVPSHDRDVWLSMGMAVKSELADGGFDLWNEWSSQDATYNPKAAKAVWKSIKPGGGIGIGTLIFEAKQHGFQFNGASQRQPPDPAELAERQRKHQEAEAARQAKADQAAKQSAIIWDKSKPCVIHAYFYFVRLQSRQLLLSYDIMQHIVYLVISYGVDYYDVNSNTPIAYPRWS